MFISNTLLSYSRGALKVWKRRRVFRMTAHFRGVKRNCYTNAIRILHRALRSTSHGNRQKHKSRSELYKLRLDAACQQLGFSGKLLQSALDRSKIALSKHTLSDLAIWEPRSFKAITHFGWKRAAEEGLNGIKELGDVPKGIITRAMLKNKGN